MLPSHSTEPVLPQVPEPRVVLKRHPPSTRTCSHNLSLSYTHLHFNTAVGLVSDDVEILQLPAVHLAAPAV